jgi:hypothetical protein
MTSRWIETVAAAAIHPPDADAGVSVVRGFHGWVVVSPGHEALTGCPWCAMNFGSPEAAGRVASLLWPKPKPPPL